MYSILLMTCWDESEKKIYSNKHAMPEFSNNKMAFKIILAKSIHVKVLLLYNFVLTLIFNSNLKLKSPFTGSFEANTAIGW